jgi:ribose-phosphate pyrophosphokinase
LHQGPRGNETLVVGDVKDKHCVIIDDMIDTAETICSASETLIDKGAVDVVAIITHGILSGDAIDRINSSCLSKVLQVFND